MSSKMYARKRNRLWREQNGRCFYCNRQVRKEDATLEHIIPKAAKGRNTYANLAMSCFECNQKQGAEFNAIAPDPETVSSAVEETTKDGPLTYRPFAELLSPENSEEPGELDDRRSSPTPAPGL